MTATTTATPNLRESRKAQSAAKKAPAQKAAPKPAEKAAPKLAAKKTAPAKATEKAPAKKAAAAQPAKLRWQVEGDRNQKGAKSRPPYRTATSTASPATETRGARRTPSTAWRRCCRTPRSRRHTFVGVYQCSHHGSGCRRDRLGGHVRPPG